MPFCAQNVGKCEVDECVACPSHPVTMSRPTIETALFLTNSFVFNGIILWWFPILFQPHKTHKLVRWKFIPETTRISLDVNFWPVPHQLTSVSSCETSTVFQFPKAETYFARFLLKSKKTVSHLCRKYESLFRRFLNESGRGFPYSAP